MNRRRFLGTLGALAWARPGPAAAVFPVKFRKPNPYQGLARFIEPGSDEFRFEKEAMEIEERWRRMVAGEDLPLAEGFSGQRLREWRRSLGEVRAARFFVLPGGRLRYEVASRVDEEWQYRVGIWRQSWRDGKLERLEPVEETVTTARQPLFEDVTGWIFGEAESFQKQLLRGVPYWRSRLDSACGIDVYGSQGIAVGDIDGDGWDEVYVCQPGGLPNRLYKRRRDGRMEDITERAGVGVLDDTASALFVDLRNTGRQDLVVGTIAGPLLFLNEGGGAFRHKPEAFRFATPPQGTLTGMAAADYDRDGRLDLYLCTYVYFQSEDQYRYPVPYFDAQNGPANFLFRNRLADAGYFEDVTAAAGLEENNNRYSFAAAWCDYDGDGWPDLYVANDFGRNNLYKNNRGKFRDVAREAGVEDLGPGMSAAWLDYDGDGRPDLYVSNMWSAPGQRVVEDAAFPRKESREAYRRHTKGNSLYRNRGDGGFDQTGQIEMGRWAWGADGFDWDNDGSPEIYVTCGMLTNGSQKDLMSFFWRQVAGRSPAGKQAAPEYENGWNALNQWIREGYSWSGREPNVLYARREGKWLDFSGVSGLDFAEDSRAFAVTDFDGDGNLDLLLKSRLGPQVRALRNQWEAGKRAIAIELRGVRSNRDAIGTRVEVEAGGRRSVQWLAAGSGYLSQHTKRLHFGLGEEGTARRVRVQWPSGEAQEFENWEAGYRYVITEGSQETGRTRFLPRQAMGSIAVAGENSEGFEATWLLEPVPIPDRRPGPGFVCLVAGEAGLEAVDLLREPAEVAAGYALFRRYLFDYRRDLELPLTLLVDDQGRAHKVYPGVPDASVRRADLARLREDRSRLALPFAGRYFAPPHRNHFRMGAAFYWAGYPEQALVYLEEVLRQSPDNARAQLAVGHIHLEAGRRGPAREHLERAVKLNPENGEAWNSLGSLEMAEQRYREAQRCFERAMEALPRSSFALLSAGRAKVKLGDSRGAEGLFRRALELDPNDAEGANQMGLLLAGENRNEEARKYFQQAIAAQRDHAGAINNLGVLYMQMEQPQEAVAAFRYGLQVAPEDETLALNLARVYLRLGERGRARETLERLLERRPGSVVVRRALAELGDR